MLWLLPLAACWAGAEPECPLVTVVQELPAAAPIPAAVPAPAAAAEPVVPATPAAEDPALPSRQADRARVLATLKAQAALRAARKALEQNDAKTAIAHLEANLPAADGNDAYLQELDHAYRQQVARHIRAGEAGEAAALESCRRALALDAQPSAARQERVLAEAAAPQPPKNVPKPQPAAEPADAKPGLLGMLGLGTPQPAPAAIPKKIDYVARGKVDHDAPRIEAPRAAEAQRGGAALAKAEQAWQARDYAEALRWYEAEYQADPAGPIQGVRNRYGYCVLRVVQLRCERLVAAGRAPSDRERAAWTADLKQGRALVNIAEYRRYADDQLRWLERQGDDVPPQAIPQAEPRRPALADADDASAAPEAPVRTLAPLRGWQRMASANFVVLHQASAEFAAKTLRLAEAGRRRAHEMYFPNEPLEPWTPACEIVLYPTPQAYTAANPGMPLSPALTRCDVRQGMVASRRMEFIASEPNLHPAILPHEVCHAALAGRFAGDSPPKWADEGLAVLTEPKQKQEDHLRALAAGRARGRGFGCLQAMRMPSYPGNEQIQDFYAQSVGMCRLLVDLGGREKLVEFIRLGAQTHDWESALLQCYGIRGAADFEGRFAEFVQRLAPRPGAAVASR